MPGTSHQTELADCGCTGQLAGMNALYCKKYKYKNAKQDMLEEQVHTQQKQPLPWMNKCTKKNLPTTAIGSTSEINGAKNAPGRREVRTDICERGVKGERKEKRVVGLGALTQGLLESDWYH